MAPLDWCAGKVCPICGGSGDFYAAVGGHALRECRGGRRAPHDPVLLSWAWGSETEYTNLYLEYNLYHDYIQKVGNHWPFDAREAELARAAHLRIKALKPYLAEGMRLCDIGTAYGIFPLVAKSFGMDACGLEINRYVADIAASRGRPVRAGSWEDMEGEYDVITLFDVFEHITRPRGCLRRLRQHLSSRGVLVVEMPEWDASNPVGEKHVRPDEHPVLYSAGAAEALFSSEAYRIIGFWRPMRDTLGKMSWALIPTTQQ